MRLIDADAFENYVADEWKNNEISNGDWIQFREWLKDQETVVELKRPITKVMVRGVEYIPVVRCKDCKYSEKTSSPITAMWCKRFGLKDMAVEADDFCSYGEREGE